jgi:hypothetical protein
VDHDDNIDWDTAYATIKTKVGGFLVGRQWNSQWGCFGIGDSTGPVDRILYVLPIENLTFIAYAQKYNEYDEVSEYSDEDNDKYAAMVRYQGENLEAGFLATFYNFKHFPGMLQMIDARNRIITYKNAAAANTTGQVTYDATRSAYLDKLNSNPTFTGKLSAITAGTQTSINQANLDQAVYASPYTGPPAVLTVPQLINASLSQAKAKDMPTVYNDYMTARTNYANAAAAAKQGVTFADSARAYIVDPYFVYKTNGFTFKGEFIYGFGDADFDGAQQDLDVDVMTYVLEAGYETGPFAMRGGYWYLSGDDDPTDDKHESFAYIQPNRDLDIAFLLTGDNDHYTSDLTDSLGGGIGNFSGEAKNPYSSNQYSGALAMAGAKMFYLGFDYKPIDTVTLGLTWANAKADKPAGPQMYGTAQWDDEVGDEFDFKVSWKPWPNLEYKFIAAYLDAGDFWKCGNPTAKIDNLTTFYNALTISF